MTPYNPLMGAARAFTNVALGGPTYEQESTITVQLTTTQLVKNNPDRVGLVIVNLGGQIVYCDITNQVSSAQGILLSASGGNFALNVRDDFTLASREWDAVATVGTSVVYILEIIRDASAAIPVPK